MDASGIMEVCDALGLDYKQSATKDVQNISISCPLAPWRHTDPADTNYSCSVLVNPNGLSLARCHSLSCDYRGTFYNLILTAVNKHQPPDPKHLEIVKRIADRERDDLAAHFEFQHAAKMLEVEAPREQFQAARATRRRSPFPPDWDRDILREDILARLSADLPPFVQLRGIKPETAEAWGLRFDVWTSRLVFPVRRIDGPLIGRTGRIVPPASGGPKYYNYSGLNKSRYLFGSHMATKGLPLVISEGPFDALKTWQALHDRANATATLGQGFTDHHSQTIRWLMPPEVYLFMDNDPGGHVATMKIATQLEPYVPLRFMRLPSGKDPGKMSSPAIVEAFERAEVLVGAPDAAFFERG